MNKKSILSILLFFLLIEGIYASHISGAEITYKHLFANTYQFKLKVYRDCRECKFNNSGGGDNTTNCNEIPNLNITGSIGTPYAHFNTFGTIEIQRKAINDLSSVCNSSISKCRPGSTAPLGYEEHVFEGVYDFSTLINEGYCKLDVSITMSSRNNTFNNVNFYNFTSINLCENIANSSVDFSSIPNFLHIVNESQFQSLGVVNPDNDSLSFSLKPGLANRATSITYLGGQSAEEPFAYYCNTSGTCPPNITGPLVEGFYISKNTGDVAFTPIMINQGSVIVVECEEWKKNATGKYYLAGITRRDVYSEIVTLNNHLPKIKNKILEYTICEGENLKIDMDIEDLPFMSTQYDSVTLEMKTSLKAANMLGLPSNLPPYNNYSIFIGNTVGLAGKYYMTVSAQDNHCPLRGKSSRTFVVNIRKLRAIKVNTSVKNCGVLDVSSTGLPNKNIYWTIRDINQNIVKQQLSKKISTQLPSGGKYIIQAFLPAELGFCEVNEIDTIVVKDFVTPVLNMGFDYSVCANTDADIKPEILKTYDAYTVLADGKTVNFPYRLKITNSTNIKIRVQQDDGCFAEDNIGIQVFPVLSYQVKQDTVCLNSQFPLSLNNIKVNKTEVNTIGLSSNNPNVSLININKTDWKLGLIKPVSTKVDVFSVMQDKHMCNYLDTFSVLIIEPDPIQVTAPERVCMNAEPINLHTMNKGQWTCLNYPELVKNNRLTIDRNNNSSLDLVYTENKQCKNSKIFKVTIMDTTQITFLHDKKLTLCESTASFPLKGLPAGGTWSGMDVFNNAFSTVNSVGRNNRLIYIYRNANNCYSRDHIEIYVDSMPALQVKAEKATICVGNILGLQAKTSFNGIGYWYTDGEGHFDNINQVISNYQPSMNDIRSDKIKFIYTLQTNGVCGNVSAETFVRVINGPAGEILKNPLNNVCEPASLTFKSTFKDIDKQYWYVDDSLVEEFDYNFDMQTVLRAGEHVIKTKVYNSSCEALAISETITVLPKPEVRMIANPTFKLSREYPRLHLKDVSYTKFGHTAQWFMNNQWISDERELYFKVNETKDSFYIKLVATSKKGGCADSLNQLFVFIPINQLYIPDAFSPDAKGPHENDSFKVKGPQMKLYEIEVYNRFGQKVYQSNDMNAAWDGTYMGKTCIQGVYFYKIVTTDFEGVSRDYSGTVTIIR
jgi:gliding motility-associated-like protein